MIRYFFFCVKWLWKNRHWENTRQKFKAMDKAWRKIERRNKNETHRLYTVRKGNNRT